MIQKARLPSRLLAPAVLAVTFLVTAANAFSSEDDPLFITQSIAIARKLIVNPATDLVDENGVMLDSDDVLAKMQAGKDC